MRCFTLTEEHVKLLRELYVEKPIAEDEMSLAELNTVDAVRAMALQEAAKLASDQYPSIDTRALAVVLLRKARGMDPDGCLAVEWDGTLALRIDAWEGLS